MPEHLGNSQGGEGPVHYEIDAEHDAADLDVGVEQVTTGSRRYVEHRDRLADQRQGCSNGLVAICAGIDRQVTDLPPRCSPQRGQVHREPLLEFTRTARGDQGRTRRPATDVDQETRPVELRAGTGECSGGLSRAARFPHRGDEDNATAHGSPGLA